MSEENAGLSDVSPVHLIGQKRVLLLQYWADYRVTPGSSPFGVGSDFMAVLTSSRTSYLEDYNLKYWNILVFLLRTRIFLVPRASCVLSTHYCQTVPPTPNLFKVTSQVKLNSFAGRNVLLLKCAPRYFRMWLSDTSPGWLMHYLLYPCLFGASHPRVP